MATSSYQPIQGMSDISSPDVYLWQMIEQRARDVLARYRFSEVRTPVLEKLDLFTHSLGDTTDVVTKEMYTLEDRGGRKLALRPEGTAGAIRFAASGGDETANARIYYMGPMFRCERPQAGRKRQFHQIGLEAVGAPNPLADAEAIALQVHLLSAWGLTGARIKINSRGLPEDQKRISEEMKRLLADHRSNLCEDCQRRMDQNVLRVIDCKNPACKQIVQALPEMRSLMSAESQQYLNKVIETLAAWEIEVEYDRNLVRGLDYYVHTVWEVVHGGLGAQNALAGGGRYRISIDGREMHGVGFAIGVERVIAALEASGVTAVQFMPPPPVFIVSLGEAALKDNLILLQMLRHHGVVCEMELSARKVQAQMRHANKCGAQRVILRGDSELEKGTFILKNMADGTQQEVDLPELMSLLEKGNA